MRLPQVSSHTLIKKFKRIGYQDAPFQGKGSHVAPYKDADGTKLPVFIPKRDPIPIGTLISIMKQARMERDEFYLFLTS
ncbi:type II toxin-antitoxin system HicA family toxin [uncultured Methanospirillum sp.]|uniref:type II toxin-antitoxin system HicA family toxin n=1 Tax=uncultured Methanospirillum sp. TaxID=262503 RepID=UPI0029C70B55|nr:type II toxin-antitoxin system HicA family toxin [uncultured Methanospirillum sp.]